MTKQRAGEESKKVTSLFFQPLTFFLLTLKTDSEGKKSRVGVLGKNLPERVFRLPSAVSPIQP